MAVTPPLQRRPIVMTVKGGTTVQIGEDIHVQIRGADRNRATLHVYAPRDLNVQREVNFTPDYTVGNSDGPSVGAPEPSAK
jgi:hypothetical protein